jgi:hypothetical protein
MASRGFFRRRVVTVEELEAMTPAERRASFEESVITDLSVVPAAFLERVRAEMAPLVAERDREQAAAAQRSE